MDPYVLMVLNNFRLENDVYENFAATDIKYNQLANMTLEDLRLLGVREDVVQTMFEEFQCLVTQEPNIEQLVYDILASNTFSTSTYFRGITKDLGMSVVDLIQNQLQSMNTLLAATMLKIGAARNAKSPGVVVGNQFTPPEVVIEMLQKLSAHTNDMTRLIDELKNEKCVTDKKKDLDKAVYQKMALKGLILTSGIIIGYFIAKIFRKKLF